MKGLGFVSGVGCLGLRLCFMCKVFRVEVLGLKMLRVSGLGLEVWGQGCSVSGRGVGVWGQGCRVFVWGVRLRVHRCFGGRM